MLLGPFGLWNRVDCLQGLFACRLYLEIPLMAFLVEAAIVPLAVSTRLSAEALSLALAATFRTVLAAAEALALLVGIAAFAAPRLSAVVLAVASATFSSTILAAVFRTA